MTLNRLLGTIFISVLLNTVVLADTTTTPPADENVYTQEKPSAMLTPTKAQFVIKLKSNPTTGYAWFLREYNTSLIQPISHEYVANTDKKLMGAPGYELWTFKARPAAFIVPQQTTIRFVYARPWASEETTTQIIFKVTTTAS